MIPDQFRLIATSAALVRAAGPAAAIWIGNAIAAQDWSEKENKESWWWATKSEIEERTGLSDEMQETARRRLRDLGVLEEKRGILRRGATLGTIWYRIEWSKLSAIVCREPRQSNADEPGKRAPETPANDHASLTPSLTAEEQHPPTPQGGKERKRRAFDPTEFDTLIPLHFQTPDLLAKWHDWMEDLKERRVRFTERAAKGHLEHLAGKARTPAVAIAWIQNAIDKGWRFPYEPRESGGVPPKPSARDSVNDSLRAQLAARQAQRGPANDADALF